MAHEYTFIPAAEVVERLMAKGWRISFAESCTGGLAAAALVDVPSASSVFDGSFVTYAPEAKSRWVGVDPETIAKCGVVSCEVAAQMACGAAKATGSQVGVGITGVAGPTGGTPETPVGTVCFGFCADGVLRTVTKQFGALGRNEVRRAAVRFVYEMLLELLK